MDPDGTDQPVPSDRLTRAELARTAAVDEALLGELVKHGILVPDARGHPPGDVYRARFAALAIESGIALDELARSMASGVVRLGDVDLIFPGPVFSTATMPGISSTRR